MRTSSPLHLVLICSIRLRENAQNLNEWSLFMHKRISFLLGTAFLLAFLINACSRTTPQPTTKPVVQATLTATIEPMATTSNQNAQPTLPNVASGENGGEAGGVESALVTFADASQHFSIGHPGPWTRDSSVKQGVKFLGGDDSMTLEFLALPKSEDAMTFATKDLSLNALAGYKQVGLAPSAEVKDAIVLGFQASGKSAVTGKTFQARGDRYYMPLTDGRIAVLTVVGPEKNYDREGVRDIALTFKVN